MIKKSKSLLISLFVLAIAFTSLGVWSLMPAKAATTMTVQEALEEFEMEGGASVRVSTQKQGIRFCAILSDGAYTALEGANAEFGMLIVPKDYVTEGYELTVENVFGNNAVYVANVKASQVPEGKKAIIQVDNPFIEVKDGVCKIHGSIIGVLDSNISRGFIGRAYVKVNGEYHFADYTDGLVENNTRSMAYVAKNAIEDPTSGVDSATLQTNYINKVKELSYSYIVNKVTVEIDGSVTTEVLESGNAKFGTEIIHEAESRFGFESYGVDSFVGMENAEFNVVYKAVPVNVVVDSDATKTELYAANELAGYIEQVTGKAVTVGVETRDTNNIYVSTDTSLNLAMDSFKLSTDAKGNIHINGTDERGTLYGVYEYEEANLGIKFLSETYTHVPFTGKQISTLSSAQEKNYVPSFAYRTYMNNGIGLDGDKNVKYSSHLRFISQFSQEKAHTELKDEVQYFMPWMAKPWLTSVHSLIYYAAIGAYKSGRTDLVSASFDANGEFTSVKFTDSTISSEAEGAIDNTYAGIPDICYSSPVAKDWVIAGLKYMIDTYGDEYDYFMLGQADKTLECDCSDCKKAITASISNFWSPKNNKADLTATFIKDVVTAVNAGGSKYSSEKIVMFAYQKTETAPKNTISGMPDNVYIQWAPIDQDRYFALDDTNPSNWTTKTGVNKFMVWSYEVDFGYYFNYYPTMHTWVDNFQTYKDLGVEAVMMQSTWDTAGVVDSYLDAYVASKLLWNFESGNATQMKALRDSAKEEFIEYFYGKDAKDLIVQYYNDFDALYKTKFSSGGYLNSGTRTFNESDLNHQLGLINEAIAKTTDATYLAHLEMLSLTPRYMLKQYCSKDDPNLLNDMSEAGVTRSREGVSIEDDSFLSGILMFKKGGTEVKTIEYDANGRIVHLVLDVPDNQEWTGATPSFTADYMQDLYKNGVRTLQMYSKSTATTGNVILTYKDTVNYGCQTVENITLAADGTEFRFNYVDVSGSVYQPAGQTIGTTLELYFNYYTENDNLNVQDEIGMMLSNGVKIFKNPVDGSYVIYNTNGNGGSAYFGASIVNDCISQGYKAVRMTVEFEPNAIIDQVVASNTDVKTDKSGLSRWTFNLTQDTPIKFWAQLAGGLSKGEFAISNIELLDYYPTYEENYATVISEQYNEQGYLTEMVVKFPEGINWADTTPRLSGAYINGLYNNGVTALTISTTVESGDYLFATIYNGVAGYNASRRISLVENGGDLQFAYVRQGGLTAEREVTISFAYEGKTSEEIAAEIGATLNGETTITKNSDGSYTVSDALGDQNGLEFSASQVNEWISQGYGTLSMHVSFTPIDGVINKTVGWTQSTSWRTDETGNVDWTFDLKQDEKICLWTQYGDHLFKASFTISNVVLNQAPQSQESIAAEIGMTLKNGSQIAKDGNGGYVLSNVGLVNNAGGMMSAYFSAEKVNEWISQGYATLSVDISFTAGDTIDQVVGLNGVSLGEGNFVELFTSGTEWTFTLTADTPIQLWAQKSGIASSGAFTLSNITLKAFDSYYTQGYATITNEQIDENNLLTGFTATFNKESFGWTANLPTLTAEYLNYLYGLGIRTIIYTVTGNEHDFITRYNGVDDYGNGNPIRLVENGGALGFSYVNVGAGDGLPVAGTINVSFRYGIDINAVIGATANGNTAVFLNGDGSYDVYDTRGMENCLEFTAEQVNAWLDQGYSSISFRLTFTPVTNVIAETVVYTASRGYIEDFSGSNDVTITLVRDQNIYVWSQANAGGQPYSTFTLSNFNVI